MVFAGDGIVVNGLPMEPLMADREMWRNDSFWRPAAPTIDQTKKSLVFAIDWWHSIDSS